MSKMQSRIVAADSFAGWFCEWRARLNCYIGI